MDYVKALDEEVEFIKRVFAIKVENGDVQSESEMRSVVIGTQAI